MRSQAIWHPAALAVYIRLEFHLSSAAAKGLLRCAASGPYEVYLNGERVGRGLGPAVAEVAMWEQFALDAALREGENVLLVFAIGCGTADWFRAEGKIERSNGAEQVLYTGAPWQVQPADAWGPASYVAVLAPAEWTKGQFRGMAGSGCSGRSRAEGLVAVVRGGKHGVGAGGGGFWRGS